MELRLPPIRDLHLAPQHYDYDYPKFQSYPQPDPDAPRPRDDRLSEVLKRCKVLCAFADHYAAAPPSLEPPEIGEMVEHAVQVINILEDYKRSTCPPPAPAPAAVRQPKRPWEDADAVPETPADSSPSASASPAPHSAPASQEAHMHVFDGVAERQPPMDDLAKAAADRDMEDIRARRAAGHSSSSTGKVKYKKRSRASPPGQCHSCEILDTPEWRRGPDGQRTLCNACGLHYAKLVRKRDRIISTLPEGAQGPPPIDIVFLRKSARLAAEHSAVNRSSGRRRAADDAKDKAPKHESSLGKRSADHLEPEAGEPSTEGAGRRGWGRREGAEQAQAQAARAPATPTYAQHTSPAHHPVPMTLPAPAPAPAPAHQTTLPSMRPSPYPAPMYHGAPHPGYQHPASYPQHGPAPSYAPMQMGYNYGYPPPPPQGPHMQHPAPPSQHHPGQAAWDRHARHPR